LEKKLRVAILGGGPSGLFMFKRLVDSGRTNITIHIFEKKKQLGLGLPYSADGASDEHITNVSGNEIPQLVTSVANWLQTAPHATLSKFNITTESYNEFKVLPRLLLGQYLSAQFDLLMQQAREKGIAYQVHFDSLITDVSDYPEKEIIQVEVAVKGAFEFDKVVICTGHNWPIRNEGIVPGYFDSPYPPAKLAFKVNHAVAIKGSSLTAIDAIRTLARSNGSFEKDKDGLLIYTLDANSAGFKMMMHSKNGMLPAVRFHLTDPTLSKQGTLTHDEIQQYRSEHDGFLPLDYVFEKNFKEMFRESEPAFYERIKDMTVEDFVNMVMDLREKVEPFHLLRAEYTEAARSIKRRESVYWKELLAILSFTMNYPAKYLPAEDMQRLQKVLMPLISIVIAFVPQSSVEEMLALHKAGVLDIVAVGDDSEIEPLSSGGIVYHYNDDSDKRQSKSFETFVDCVGQPHLSYSEFPYKSLREKETISPAKLRFKDPAIAEEQLRDGNKDIETDGQGNYALKVSGITINNSFEVVNAQGNANKRIYMMAVPYIGGYNPDYSGLDFCEEASGSIIKSLLNN
jgi:7,8-dihydro-6-hydroxymethylpterin-pyrophosphokinase